MKLYEGSLGEVLQIIIPIPPETVIEIEVERNHHQQQQQQKKIMRQTIWRRSNCKYCQYIIRYTVLYRYINIVSVLLYCVNNGIRVIIIKSIYY